MLYRAAMKRTLLTALSLLPLVAAFAASAAPAGANPVVVMKTSMGTVKIELYPDRAPATVKNFLQYVDDNFYAGTIFHRVIDGFMVQGGGFDREMKKKPTRPPVVNEAATSLKNVTGTVAMARTSDPNSATAQFFINVKDNAPLDYRGDSPQEIGYCAFGKVVEGMDVVNKIKGVPTGTKDGMKDVPTTPVVIESIERAK